MLHAGTGVTRVNIFLMAINIPTISTASLMKRQIEVRPAVGKVVWSLLLQKGHVNRIFSMNKTDSSSCIFCPTMWYIWLDCTKASPFWTVILYIKIHAMCDFEGFLGAESVPKNDCYPSVFYCKKWHIRLDCTKSSLKRPSSILTVTECVKIHAMWDF